METPLHPSHACNLLGIYAEFDSMLKCIMYYESKWFNDIFIQILHTIFLKVKSVQKIIINCVHKISVSTGKAL